MPVVSSCVDFLPQPSLHLAVLLFKNAVSCGLLTSISLACIWLQTSSRISFLHWCWWVSPPTSVQSLSPPLGGCGGCSQTIQVFAVSQILALGQAGSYPPWCFLALAQESQRSRLPPAQPRNMRCFLGPFLLRMTVSYSVIEDGVDLGLGTVAE